MQTSFFTKNDVTRDEGFRKDVETLLTLPDDALARLPAHAATVMLAPSGRETENARELASQDLKVPRSHLDHALKLAQYFIRHFLKTGDAAADNPAGIAADLAHVLQLELQEERQAAIAGFFESLKRVAQDRAEKEIDRRTYAQSSLPLLESISTTVNYRVVFDEWFKVDSDIATYTPKCLGTIPLGIIQLGFDEEPIKQVFFQADRRTIRILIDHLRALEKELDVAREQLHLEEANDGCK